MFTLGTNVMKNSISKFCTNSCEYLFACEQLKYINMSNLVCKRAALQDFVLFLCLQIFATNTCYEVASYLKLIIIICNDKYNYAI